MLRRIYCRFENNTKPLRRKYTYLEADVTWKEGGHEWVWLTEIRSFQATDGGDSMASINKGLTCLA